MIESSLLNYNVAYLILYICIYRISYSSKYYIQIWILFMSSYYMDVSENSGTPNSSIWIGFSIINHPFWGTTIVGNIHISMPCCQTSRRNLCCQLPTRCWPPSGDYRFQRDLAWSSNSAQLDAIFLWYPIGSMYVWYVCLHKWLIFMVNH